VLTKKIGTFDCVIFYFVICLEVCYNNMRHYYAKPYTEDDNDILCSATVDDYDGFAIYYFPEPFPGAIDYPPIISTSYVFDRVIHIEDYDYADYYRKIIIVAEAMLHHFPHTGWFVKPYIMHCQYIVEILEKMNK